MARALLSSVFIKGIYWIYTPGYLVFLNLLHCICKQSKLCHIYVLQILMQKYVIGSLVTRDMQQCNYAQMHLYTGIAPK